MKLHHRFDFLYYHVGLLLMINLKNMIGNPYPSIIGPKIFTRRTLIIWWPGEDS